MKVLAIVALSASMMWAAVNINTASKSELMELPGIGDKKADAIIEYRTKSKFKTIDEIKSVSGIGDKIYEDIKVDLIVNGITDTKNLKSVNKNKKKQTKKENKDNNSTK
ncbi:MULTISPECIES: ComEA family DNA-binding protein [Campylobacter]|uniref:ComE family competence protein n=1 Tax=Campylobacter vicugnae TaxID=1660076 RepID=A0A1X9T210_9BACT|nr:MULTISPECIES: helix-hairpin-helix domain-containing protein [Campylobacter]MCR8690125.1 helix-hairpin-helix domain-containing protein [Campylobacter sp. RM9264]MCR8700769.1 helix-hairpin-helix domain-containing protein [Campylobacter sp. RM12176]ARR02572.1 putative ComE family competence protein [Campylobacter sp. RM8964]ARR04204.1 putative ComE family competence protein [Campylobacter sp. RM12175]MBO5063557.1 helix-hairpin-helix domain-containing protein [Campylobacter sp.]